MPINFEGKPYSAEELKVFISQKYDFWKFIIDADPGKFKEPSTIGLANRIKEKFSGLQTLYSVLTKLPLPSEQNIEKTIQNHLNTISQIYRSTPNNSELFFAYFPPEDTTNKVDRYFMGRSISSDADIYWLAYQFKLIIELSNYGNKTSIPSDLLMGYVGVWASEHGLDIAMIQGQKQSYEILVTDLKNILEKRSEIDALSESANALKSNLDDQLSAIKEQTKEQSDNYQLFLQKKEQEFSSFQANEKQAIDDTFNNVKQTLTKEFDDLRQTFENKIALQAPIKYWNDAKDKFSKKSIMFGLSALASAVVLCYFLIDTSHSFTLSKDQSIIDFFLSHLGEMSVVLIAIWFVRLMVRNFLTNLHLLTDAGLKGVMIETYLSLGQKGTPFSSENERLMLSAIFTMPKTGLVRDDASPIGAFETFAKR